MSLLERFRKGSKYNADGEFTLDEDRAKKKMAHFQLSSVEEAIFLAIQALASAKSTRIELGWKDKSGGHALTLVGRGAKLNGQRQERCREEVFASDTGSLPYHLLGVALNSVDPSCRETPSVVYENNDLVLEIGLKGLLSGVDAQVRKRVRHFDGEFVLNGTKLPQEPVSADSLQLHDQTWTELTLIRFGVVIERKSITTNPSFSALIECPRFALDASYSHVVEDDNYRKRLKKVTGAAVQKIAELAKEAEPEEHTRLRKYLLTVKVEPAAKALRRAKIFPLADREGFCSYTDLEKGRKRTSKILISRKRLNLKLDQLVVFNSSGSISQTLEKLYPSPGVIVNAEGAYRRKLEAERNRKAWEESPRPTELPPGDYYVKEQIQGRSWQAEIGFRKGVATMPTADVLLKNKLLGSDKLSVNLAPGAVAVVNFDTLEVDEMWTRGTGRTYRSAISELNRRLKSLFDRFEPFTREQLTPDMELHLLERLAGPNRNLSAVDADTPLFLTCKGGYVSLSELRQVKKVYLGKPFTPKAENFPDEILPEPLLWDSTSVRKILNKRLGGQRVANAQSVVERCREIDKQLLNPRSLVLDPSLEPLATARVEEDDFTAELAILNEAGDEFEWTVLHQGVAIEERSVSCNLSLIGVVILQSHLLSPEPDWSGLDRSCTIYRDIRDRVKENLVALEIQILRNPKTERSTRLELLLQHLDLIEEFENAQLFGGMGSRQTLSLAIIRDELEQHGEVLTAHSPIECSRPVLTTPLGVEAKLLQRVFQDQWKVFSAEAYVARLNRRTAFENQKAVDVIKLSGAGKFLKTVPSTIGQGELGIRFDRHDYSGSVLGYIEGRHAGSLSSILPRGCTAAIQHEGITHLEDFSGVQITLGLQNELRAHCIQEAVSLLSHDNPTIRNQALTWFRNLPKAQRPKEEILQEPLVQMYGGGRITIAEAWKQFSKSVPYVGPDFAVDVKTEKLILQHERADLRFMMEILGKELHLNKMEAALKIRKKEIAFLAGLDTKVTFESNKKEFVTDGLSAVLGVCSTSRLYGFTTDKQKLGVINWSGLPIRGHVFGLQPSPGSTSVYKQPEPTMNKKQKECLQEWVVQTYLDWAEDLRHQSLDDTARGEAVFVLSRVSRFITSSSTEPRARLAQTLWDLPLFERGDDTWVSGSSLVLQFAECQEPIQVTTKGFRLPPDVLISEDFSEELALLRSVLGKDAVVDYEHPPLIDTAQIASSARNVVSWGLTPIRLFKDKVDDLVDKLAEKMPEKKKKISPEVLEQRLLHQFHADLNQLLGRKNARKAEEFFEGTEFGSWPLGPAVYRKPNGDHRFNRMHPAIRWLLTAKKNANAREARMLILLNWVGLVNVVSEELTDQHEDEFLIGLAEVLEQSLGGR